MRFTDLRVQLHNLRLSYRFMARGEIRELAKLLKKDEQLKHCSYGFYQGGSALLAATNKRLLLIDKRILFLNIEEIRYPKIISIKYLSGMMDAHIDIKTKSRNLSFKSLADNRLNKLKKYVDSQIKQIRITDNRNISAEGDFVIDAFSKFQLSNNSLIVKRRIAKFPVS